jgi:RNA polymerase subunit RPABC4/transcription elongation factor Spt4
MERICTHCHAILADDTNADWCPACGGALIERENLSKKSNRGAAVVAEVDHRGIVLPVRHAVGGIITPV